MKLQFAENSTELEKKLETTWTVKIDNQILNLVNEKEDIKYQCHVPPGA